MQYNFSSKYCYNYKLFSLFNCEDSPSSQFPVNRDRGRTQSSNSTESTDSATSLSSTGSGGSGESLLPPTTSASAPSHTAPAKSSQLLYAQLNVKQTQVSPPANDDHVQYAQIEHQDKM